jgi:hypothetical protein
VVGTYFEDDRQGVLQMIFRPDREKPTRGRRKQREKLHDMRSSQSIIELIKYRRIRLGGGVHRVFWWGKLQQRDRLVELGICRKILGELMF